MFENIEYYPVKCREVDRQRLTFCWDLQPKIQFLKICGLLDNVDKLNVLNAGFPNVFVIGWFKPRKCLNVFINKFGKFCKYGPAERSIKYPIFHETFIILRVMSKNKIISSLNPKCWFLNTVQIAKANYSIEVTRNRYNQEIVTDMEKIKRKWNEEEKISG